jgi:hypothetical protein
LNDFLVQMMVSKLLDPVDMSWTRSWPWSSPLPRRCRPLSSIFGEQDPSWWWHRLTQRFMMALQDGTLFLRKCSHVSFISLILLL